MPIRVSWKKLLLWTCVLVVFCGLLGAGAVATLFYWASRDLPNISRIADYNPPQATTVLARNGEVLGTLCTEKRYVISLEDMSPFLPQAFLAAEDDSFYHHMGVDPVAILRAAINNFRKGHMGEGGSTITQQLIKQLLLTSERSYTRKMKEAILAYRIEKDLSKKEILTIYLNQIYLGEHAYGVEAAARTYFGKHAADITLAESAVIAGLPKAPSRYNPFRSPKAAKDRQMYVLGRLRDLGWITTEQYAQAAAEPLVYWSMPDGMGGPALWYLEEARRLLVEFFTESNLKALGVETARYGEEYVYEAGLTVRTAMVPAQQEAAGNALRRGLEELDKRQGWRGAVQMEPDKVQSFGKDASFTPRDLAGDAWVRALVTAVEPGRALVALGKGYTGVIPAANMSWARKPNPKVAAANAPSIKDARQVLAPGDLIWVSAAPMPAPEGPAAPAAKGKQPARAGAKNLVPYDPERVRPGSPIMLRLQQEPLVQGALASLEPDSGDVVALIGGYSFGDSHFNRATQARRQPGSSFKPVVYSTALDFGFTPSSIVLDAPFVYVNPYTNEVWRPSNYEHNYKGELPLWQALALSRNTCTVRVAQQVGIANVIQRAKAMGLEPHFPQELSVSLGAVAVSPLNLTQAYAAFANQGMGVRPRIITSITDAKGRELYRQDPEHWQALSPQNAYMMATLLKNVVNAGTGSRAKIDGRFIAGKTGTTNEEHDAWFVGFTPYLVTGVYVGYDQLQPLGRLEQGGRTAAPIFRYYRSVVEDFYEPRDFAMPEGIVMSGNMAYRADQPMEGVSATDGLESEPGEDTSEGGEDLMRQMF
ncbi:PBP1A family penicillin-binding protein [Desulfovibrio sp.]|uniref:penicillin-binding protein 1A n=1 Tax=Desulfovibrio sp. TaxID=885 RepID=UPI0023BF0897|nr:PBP1A family penicillin-binding protein [Desulfovibrio sp.]MDE7241934.1 PBP1A family penicillin-binding protein [Desulfovibrio sp.]